MCRKRVRAIAFDLDNTLWNTETTIGAANWSLINYLQSADPSLAGFQEADLMAETKFLRENHPEKAFDWNFLRRKSIQNILERHKKAHLTDEAWDAYYSYRNRPDFFPGAVKCLNRMKKGDLLLCSFTDGNANPDLIKEITNVFDFHVSAIEAGAEKPDMRMFNLLKSKLGLAVEEIVVVGDSFERDISGAKAAGMRTIWVPRVNKDGTTTPTIEEAARVADLILPGGVKDLTMEAIMSL